MVFVLEKASVRSSIGRFIITAVVMLLIAVSGAAFVADLAAGLAVRQLDDPLTQYRDTVDLSTETLPVYASAIAAFELAGLLAPLNEGYSRSSAELLFRVAVWRDMMAQMNTEVPNTELTDGRTRKSSLRHMLRTVALDPANANNRIMLGYMYAGFQETQDAREQFILAADLYPANAEIRYTSALQLLLLGYPEDAAEQARILARRDDSYRSGDDPAARLSREMTSTYREARLSSSYLYKALELLWRSSGKNMKTVLGAVPDDDEAREVARLFVVQKGVTSNSQK